MSDPDAHLSQPFFIVGTGRCGSTLLYQILRRHDRIGLTNEVKIIDLVYFFTQYAALESEKTATFSLSERVDLAGLVHPGYTQRISEIVASHARAIIAEFYASEFPDTRITHFGEKLPGVHAAHAFGEVFPETKYIVLVRDPRDVLVSYRAHRKRKTFSATTVADQSVEHYAREWCSIYGSATQYLRHHIVVRYEDLVMNPMQTTRRVMDFLELPMQHGQTNEIDGRDSVFSEYGTATSPEASIGRWLSELDSREIGIVSSVCGDLMETFGYHVMGEGGPAAR